MMGKGRTAFEIIKGWFKGKPLPVEKQFHNPLDARIGSHIRFINLPEMDDLIWTISEIWEWDRKINGKSHKFTDYLIESVDHDLKFLRVFDKISNNKTEEIEILLMQQYWPEDSSGPQAWGEETPYVLEGLMDETGEFVRYKGEPQEERYFRDLCNIHSDVSIVSDSNKDGTIELDEVQKEQYSLWTFRRVTTDIAKQEFEQHLHAQLSGFYGAATKTVKGGDKDLLILRGESVSPLNIMVY